MKKKIIIMSVFSMFLSLLFPLSSVSAAETEASEPLSIEVLDESNSILTNHTADQEIHINQDPGDLVNTTTLTYEDGAKDIYVYDKQSGVITENGVKIDAMTVSSSSITSGITPMNVTWLSVGTFRTDSGVALQNVSTAVGILTSILNFGAGASIATTLVSHAIGLGLDTVYIEQDLQYVSGNRWIQRTVYTTYEHSNFTGQLNQYWIDGWP